MQHPSGADTHQKHSKIKELFAILIKSKNGQEFMIFRCRIFFKMLRLHSMKRKKEIS